MVRGICSSVRASKVLTYSSRGQMGMLPIQPGSDLPCRERGVGWDGPWLDESDLQGTETSLGGGVSHLGRYKAIVAGWWRRRPTAPGWVRRQAGRDGPKRKKLRV